MPEFDALAHVPTSQRPAWPRAVRQVARPLLASLAGAILIAAVTGGLWRLGIVGPAPALGVVAAGAHAALMLSGLLGLVIGIERAVAIRHRWAWGAPLAAGAGALSLLAGHADIGAMLGVLAALIFVAVNVVVIHTQRAAHTVLLLCGAVAWMFGQTLFAAGASTPMVLPWWFAFAVLTIAAERLEMTRMTRHHADARPWLWGIVAALVAGAAASGEASPVHALGGALYGTALMALSLWLAVFDVARRTVRAHGLTRYMAVCLLGGQVWLFVAGLAWMGTALGCPGRDIALHALGLGFVFSMVMAHAPVILPAVAGVKLRFGFWFYLPPAMLHVSLLVRLFGGMTDPARRALGAQLNAGALALFALTLAGSALARWLAHRTPPAPRPAPAR